MDISIELALAKKCVDDFDALMTQHREAMKCRDCEELLRLGIEAAEWLQQADKTLRAAAIKGLPVSQETVVHLNALFNAWMKPVPYALKQVEDMRSQKWDVGNLKEFEAAIASVKQRIAMTAMSSTIENAFRGQVFDKAFWDAADQMSRHD